MRTMAALLVLFVTSCNGTPPVIVSALVRSGAESTPTVLARTNLRQTFIRAEVGFVGEVLTSQGLPIYVNAVDAGADLWIDRDQDVRERRDFGSPLPPGARVLFPRQVENAELEIVFEDD